MSNKKLPLEMHIFMHSHIFLIISGSYLSEGAELWRKQSQMKDIELSRTTAELNIVCTELLRNEGIVSPHFV